MPSAKYISRDSIVDKCLDIFESRFVLTIFASQRAKALYLGAKPAIEDTAGMKHIDVALKEIALGLITRESILESFNHDIQSIMVAQADESHIDAKAIIDNQTYDDFNISFDD